MRELSGPPIKSTIYAKRTKWSPHWVTHSYIRMRNKTTKNTNQRKPDLIEVNVTNSNLHIGATLQSIRSHFACDKWQLDTSFFPFKCSVVPKKPWDLWQENKNNKEKKTKEQQTSERARKLQNRHNVKFMSMKRMGVVWRALLDLIFMVFLPQNCHSDWNMERFTSHQIEQHFMIIAMHRIASPVINANWFNYQDVCHSVNISAESMCVCVRSIADTLRGLDRFIHTVDLIGTKLSRL